MADIMSGMSGAVAGSDYSPQIGWQEAMSVASPWVAAGSSLIGTILQGIGLWNQIQDAKAQRKLMTKWREEDIARDNEKYQTELAMTRDKLLWDKRQSQRQWKWMEEERGYQRSMDLLQGLTNLFAQKPVLEDRLMNVWRR